MRPEAFHSDDVRVVRRNPWALLLAALPIPLGLVVAFVLGSKPAELVIVINFVGLGLFCMNYVWRKNPWARSVPVRTHGDAQRATLGSLTVRRDEIKNAFLLPRVGRRPLVRIARKTWFAPAIELELPHVGEARRFLRAMGLDGSQTVASFRLPSRVLAHRYRTMAASVAMMVIVVVGSRFSHGVFDLEAMAPLVLLLTLLFIVPSTLSVGVDGILLGWFGRKRFVRHADIERLSTYEDGFGKSRYVGIELLLASGEVLKLPIRQSGWDDGELEIIEERIREARGGTRDRAGAKDTAVLLGREGRSLSDWMTSLRAIGSGANATHRIAPIDPETLWQILEDPRAQPWARGAAAVALRTALDEEGRERMHAAAQATVAPKVRVVLETAAGNIEEEELALALAEINETESKS